VRSCIREGWGRGVFLIFSIICLCDGVCYGVAMTSRLLRIIGLFGKRALYKTRYSAKETYKFKEPTNRSHPICIYLYVFVYVCICSRICWYMFVYVCICLYMFVYVCICLYMFV